MKKLIVGGLSLLVIIGILIIGYALYSANSSVEGTDVSPLGIGGMDPATKAEFDRQMKEAEGNVMVMNDAMPSASLVSKGLFRDAAHHVEGSALVIEQSDGSKILRFEDFETINGPRLHIYLSTSTDNDDFVDLGKIKATSGDVNYVLPEGIDLEKYDKVLVWCVPFGVLFSYSDLDDV